MPPGHAVVTSAGKLPFKAIIHVAGINMFWRSTERSIRDSVRNALQIAEQQKYQSVALPLIGAGCGGGRADHVLSIIRSELSTITYDGDVVIVKYDNSRD